MIVDTIRYDTNTIQYIYVRSKADEMASLIYRTAQQRQNKRKTKNKNRAASKHSMYFNVDK